ncbi:MAG: metal-sensing transcriptional repressor [Lachnospiraceae bacterium]|nr:metal-sensing transcriptional repressor [Lachnospiraceae bacterium]
MSDIEILNETVPAEEECTGSCCHGIHEKTDRSEEQVRKLLNRLNRIEGQIRGIQKMVENNAYCPDILVQVSAASCALNSFSRELLASHIRNCVADDIRSGNDETIEELVKLTQKLMK